MLRYSTTPIRVGLLYPLDLTWIGLREYIERAQGPLILPIGSVESHGAHLPINTDTLIASFIADTLAERNGWVSLPPITYTIAIPARPGNVYVPPTVFRGYLRSILEHFIAFGQKFFVIVMGHGGPDMKSSVRDVCSSLCREYGVTIAAFHVSQVLKELRMVDTSKDRHAGMWETSIVMAIDPSLVKSLDMYRSQEDLRVYGVAGNPLEASPSVGQAMIEAIVKHVESMVRKLHGVCFFNWAEGQLFIEKLR